MGVKFKLTIIVSVFSLIATAPALALSSSNEDRAVKNLCTELLTKPDLMPAVDVKGAPGLRILATELYGSSPEYKKLLKADTDAFHPHELISSARYAKLINSASGETVLMVPGIEHKSIPGFDGVIFDANGKPVANYSLKTLITATADRTPLKRAWDGVRQAVKFSNVERWLLMLKLLYEDQSGHLHISDTRSEETLKDTKAWLAKSMQLFGVKNEGKTTRPTRVVVDIQSELPMPSTRDVEVMKEWIVESKGLIEAIIFLKDDEVLEVK